MFVSSRDAAGAGSYTSPGTRPANLLFATLPAQRQTICDLSLPTTPNPSEEEKSRNNTREPANLASAPPQPSHSSRRAATLVALLLVFPARATLHRHRCRTSSPRASPPLLRQHGSRLESRGRNTGGRRSHCGSAPARATSMPTASARHASVHLRYRALRNRAPAALLAYYSACRTHAYSVGGR